RSSAYWLVIAKPKKLLRDRSRISSQRSWKTGYRNSAAIDADAGLGHTGGPADSGAAANIFEYSVECSEDVTNAMLISTLWRTVGDKVLHMTYSTKAAIKPLRAHPYPLKKLVFSLDDEAFHEPNSVWFEPEHVEVVFFDDLFVSNYISGNIRFRDAILEAHATPQDIRESCDEIKQSIKQSHDAILEAQVTRRPSPPPSILLNGPKKPRKRAGAHDIRVTSALHRRKPSWQGSIGLVKAFTQRCGSKGREVSRLVTKSAHLGSASEGVLPSQRTFFQHGAGTRLHSIDEQNAVDTMAERLLGQDYQSSRHKAYIPTARTDSASALKTTKSEQPSVSHRKKSSLQASADTAKVVTQRMYGKSREAIGVVAEEATHRSTVSFFSINTDISSIHTATLRQKREEWSNSQEGTSPTVATPALEPLVPIILLPQSVAQARVDLYTRISNNIYGGSAQIYVEWAELDKVQSMLEAHRSTHEKIAGLVPLVDELTEMQRRATGSRGASNSRAPPTSTPKRPRTGTGSGNRNPSSESTPNPNTISTGDMDIDEQAPQGDETTEQINLEIRPPFKKPRVDPDPKSPARSSSRASARGRPASRP
ncbi:hypothetical protein KCU67_g3724, partial [Aureobasidium melanogenum]